MARTKLIAVLLGPSGVGLVGLYMSAIGLVGTFAALGIDSSGVREVAEASGSGDAEKIARTVKTLRRVCWATGLLGWLLTAALSYPLSVWTFGSGERVWAVAILGVTLLFGAVSNGQSAFIQGTRRIGDLARLNVLGAIAGTIIALGLYGWLGQRGIVPVFITSAAANLGFFLVVCQQNTDDTRDANLAGNLRQFQTADPLGTGLHVWRPARRDCRIGHSLHCCSQSGFGRRRHLSGGLGHLRNVRRLHPQCHGNGFLSAPDGRRP